MFDVLSESPANVGVVLHHEFVPVGESVAGGLGVSGDQVDAEVGLVVCVAEQTGITFSNGM